MDQNSFTWWLQGFVELNGGEMPTKEQWALIKEHLALVFNKVTSPLGSPPEKTYCNYNLGNVKPYFDGMAPDLDFSKIPYTC